MAMFKKRPKVDEGMGSGGWKKVRRIHDEMGKKESWREMELLIKEAKDVARTLTGLDKLHAEIYLRKMEETLASWKAIEKSGLRKKK